MIDSDPAAAVAARQPAPGVGPAIPDRRTRRRQETIAEILDIAVQIMTDEGVGGLTIAGIARRLGVQAPSIYKYFPSLLSIYDELFRRGQADHLHALRAAAASAPAGMATVHATATAAARWAAGNTALAQLLFWRPVPHFTPSPQAFEPSKEMFQLFLDALSGAVSTGELAADAATSAGVDFLSTLVAGVISQHMANEPGTPWGTGRFAPLLPRLIELLRCAYPPPSRPTDRPGDAPPAPSAPSRHPVTRAARDDATSSRS
jgi:AcrR family transcriptional regulator